MAANFSAEIRVSAARMVGGQSWHMEVRMLPQEEGISPVRSERPVIFDASRQYSGGVAKRKRNGARRWLSMARLRTRLSFGAKRSVPQPRKIVPLVVAWHTAKIRPMCVR